MAAGIPAATASQPSEVAVNHGLSREMASSAKSLVGAFILGARSLIHARFIAAAAMLLLCV